MAVLIFLGKLGILIAIGVSLLLWGLSRLLGTARAKDIVEKLALLLASVMIAVLLGEVVVRIALKGITTTGDSGSYFARRWASEHVHFNSSGFREREFEFTKPRGSYRIAVIGDSYTFGQGIEKAERFSDLLELELGREHRRIEVLNFGSLCRWPSFYFRRPMIPRAVIPRSRIPSAIFMNGCWRFAHKGRSPVSTCDPTWPLTRIAATIEECMSIASTGILARSPTGLRRMCFWSDSATLGYRV